MLYNRVSISENPSTQILSLPLSDLSLLSSFFSSFSSLLPSLLRPAAAPTNSSEPGQHPGARTKRGLTRAAQARPRPVDRHQPRPDPAQSRPASPGPFRGQLVRELSYSRRSRFVDGLLVCTHRLVAAIVIVTYELSKIDSEVCSSQNGLSKI